MSFFTAKSPIRSAALSLVTALGLFMPTDHEAAQPPEYDLRQLRAQFRESLLKAILPEQKDYQSQLAELEKKLVAAHDYAGAIQARDERLALEQEITAFEQEMPRLTARAAGSEQLLPERIVFKPAEASLSGLTLGKDGSIQAWESTSASATWKLPKLPAGGYEVFLKYVSGKEDVGFKVKESFYFLRGKMAPSNGRALEKPLGTLRIHDGEGTLTLSAESLPKSGPVRLVALELAPVNR